MRQCRVSVPAANVAKPSRTSCFIATRRAASGGSRLAGMVAPWTPETAREEAKRLLGEVAQRADPAAEKRSKRNAKTVAELCDLYLADAMAGRLLTRRVQKKPSTLAIDAGRIERHIKPLLGRRTVSDITRDDVEAFMQDVAAGKTAGRVKSGKQRGLARVRGGRGAANRAVGLLGAIFTYAVRARLRSDNPVHGVMRPPDGRRDRRLAEDEYLRFGRALKAAIAAGVWPPAIAAARFLAVTGWRSGEALSLRWDDIDLPRRTVKLRDTKTGVFFFSPLISRRLRCIVCCRAVRRIGFPRHTRNRRCRFVGL
jgi:integrase